MKRRGALAGLAAAMLWLAFAPVSEATAEAGPATSAIVKIHATVSADARTAATLGQQREGSGVVIDDNGLIVTIGYLILEASSIEVELADGKTVSARSIAYDHDTGLGLLRALGPTGASSMPLGRSDDLGSGTPVLIAGYSDSGSAQPAFVVKRDTFAGYWEYLLENAIFTAPPHPQFGGAALIDEKGELVGIGSLMVPNAIERADGNIPGNMFVPIDALKPILADLITRGHSRHAGRPWLGLYAQFMGGRVFVGRVPRSGPAWSAGIRPGDLILGVAEEPMTSLADFYRKVWALGDAGVEVPLQVLQGLTSRTLRVRSMDRRNWLRLRQTY